MGGDPVAHAVRLLHERGDLGAGELRRVRVLELDRARAGRHDLDEVGAAAQLLADRLADLVRPVGLAVHAVEELAARPGRGHDAPARQQARPPEGAVAHRLARRDDEVVERADVAHRGDAHPQHLAEVRGQEVRGSAGPDRLLAFRGRGHAALRVRVGVDEPRHQRATREVKGDRALRRRIGGVADALDRAVLDQHRGAVADGAGGAVEQPGVREPQAAVGRGRGGEERGEAGRHVRRLHHRAGGSRVRKVTARRWARSGSPHPPGTAQRHRRRRKLRRKRDFPGGSGHIRLIPPDRAIRYPPSLKARMRLTRARPGTETHGVVGSAVSRRARVLTGPEWYGPRARPLVGGWS